MKQYEQILNKIKNDDITGLEKMFKRGVNVNFKMQDNLNYLIYSVTNECPNAIKLLIKYNADVLAQDIFEKDFIYHYFVYMKNMKNANRYVITMSGGGAKNFQVGSLSIGKINTTIFIGKKQNVKTMFAPTIKTKNRYSIIKTTDEKYRLMKKALSNLSIQNKIFKKLSNDKLIETVLLFNEHEMLHNKFKNKFSYITSSNELNLL